MLKSQGRKKMKIRFGRGRGEKTLAEIVKVNPKNFKVKQLEKRGRKKTHPVGTIWNVPPSMCEPAENSLPEKYIKEKTAEACSKRVDEVDPVKKADEEAVKFAEALKENCDLANPPTYIKASLRYLEGHSITRHGAEYDSQRKKLYKAERPVTEGKSFANIREARSFVDKITGTSWFKRRFGDITIKMEMTQGWTRSYCRRDTRLIRMLPQHLNERVIIHELTHALACKPHAGHGRLFCAMYLDLVRHFMGEKVYDALLKGYRREGVKYHPHRSTKR